MAPLSHDDYVAHDATGLAGLVRRREVADHELLDAALRRLACVNGSLNAVTALYEARARARSAVVPSDAAFGGVPFLIKDLFTDLAGTVCENGSAFFSPAPAVSNSTVVDTFEAAGFLIFGRTHSPEFGGTSTSESRRHGVTLNPFDLTRTAGGSSGGAAAAVASGVVPVAHATDAGGSIIIPAACCGLFGLKPSRGRVALGPSRFEGAAGLAVQHVLTRTVRDSAALLDIECSGERMAAHAPPYLAGGFARAIGEQGRRLKIALVGRSVHGIEPAAECLTALEDTATLCQSLGHAVEPVTLPVSAQTFWDAERALRLASVAMTVQGIEHRVGRLATEADLEPVTWQRYRAGLDVSGTDILQARERMLETEFTMQCFMQDYDAILSPAMAELPPSPGTISLEHTDAAAAALNRRYTSFSGLYNWTGQPSMSVPLGTTKNGIPVGVLLAGRYGDEALLLGLAAELEEANRWTGLAPQSQFLTGSENAPGGRE